MTWETAYFNAMRQMGMVANGRAYMAKHPQLRARYTFRRKSGMSIKKAMGYAMADCEKMV